MAAKNTAPLARVTAKLAIVPPSLKPVKERRIKIAIKSWINKAPTTILP